MLESENGPPLAEAATARGDHRGLSVPARPGGAGDVRGRAVWDFSGHSDVSTTEGDTTAKRLRDVLAAIAFGGGGA